MRDRVVRYRKETKIAASRPYVAVLLIMALLIAVWLGLSAS
jgi:hypothetical protein